MIIHWIVCKGNNLKTNPKFIIGTYFDTKLSMFDLAPYAMDEGAKGPQKGPKGPPALHRS